MLFLQTTSDAASAGASVVLLAVYAIVSLAVLAVYIYVLMDILKQPDSAWQMSGQNKSLWIGLWVAGLCCGFGLIIALIYWFAIRPKLVSPPQIR